MDGAGIGEMPDAAKYNDQGSNTLGNTADYVHGLNIPNLEKMGLGNIAPLQGVKIIQEPIASYGKMAELALDKDSTSGHWEITGLNVKRKFPTYPKGFPDYIINKFVELTGIPGILCNKPYSGTEVIRDFGEEHIKTKKPIIYTSADSVMQIAVHEDIYPIKEFYKMCEIARTQVFPEAETIGRIIARPFIGDSPENFHRTGNRKDYSIAPPRPTLLDILKKANYEVIGVGKIDDLFKMQGLTETNHSKTNEQGIQYTLDCLKKVKSGLIFANLCDFDSKWGHRNNPEAFAKGLEYFDSRIPEILKNLKENDILFITADHGNDPVTPSTDHSREYVPLLVYGKEFKSVNLNTRSTFSDIAATIAEHFQVKQPENGTSFLKEIMN